ncbi:uncharacterized protein VNE69_04184 [Vairimorpha necatrix]|uniref:Uncharacterized protein n=1 Tax=Vairimorpha necatrix TaxID=6039 RepID=A0AAX4JBV4_9MICR
MKIKINSLDTLISQICKKLPPSSKEDLKVLNKLKLFIDKNTIPNNDTRKTEYTDILFNKTLDISYLRRDFCKEINEEYKKWTLMYKSIITSQLVDNISTVVHNEINISTNDLEDIKKMNEESVKLLERMDKILVERKGHYNTEKGIIKYFRSL